ncbi:MAG: CPBP family intramembrane metalloprotease [Tissierellia bacterium]|nr:CPBP family intramembrane metalloprotease [Tissierellia bacterium]
MIKHWRAVAVVIISLISTWLLLFFLKNPLFNIDIFQKDIIDFYLNYELSTIILSLIFLFIIYILADKVRLKFFNINKLDGEVLPEPWVGIVPKKKESWKNIGLSVGSIITISTAVVVYFQTAHGRGITISMFPEVPMLLILALMNSFTEEVIFRLSYSTIIANEGLNPRIAEVLAAVVFGGVHYVGIAPNGIAGAIMAGYIGWFLAKSINETNGFFWAWVVHFAQDVVILFFLFMRNG